MTHKRLYGIDIMLSFASKAAPTFRRAAFATAAIVGASVLAAFPAAAQQLKSTNVSATPGQITATTDCKMWKPGELMASTECEILKGRLLEAQNACIAEIVKFKKADPDQFTKLNFGTVTRDNACTFATRIPKRSAALQK